MLICDGVGIMLLERERGRWKRQTIGIGRCHNEDEAEKVEKADFVATTSSEEDGRGKLLELDAVTMKMKRRK